MKNYAIRTLLFSFFSLLLLSSCRMMMPKPISSARPSNNKSYVIEYLFEHDGCKVYRFVDQGQWVYFTNCNNSVSSYSKDSTGIKVVNNKIIQTH